MIAPLLSRLRGEPALVLGLVQSVIALVAAFGLELSAEQTGAILAVTAAVLSIVTRQLVTPASRPPEPPASAGPGAALLVPLAILALTGCTSTRAKQACGPTVTLSTAALLEACTLAYQRAPDVQAIHELDLVCLPLGGVGEALERPDALAHLCGEA